MNIARLSWSRPLRYMQAHRSIRKKRTRVSIALTLIAGCIAGCGNDEELQGNAAVDAEQNRIMASIAVIDPHAIREALRTYAMKQNPNPHGSPREQRALLNQQNKLSRQYSQLQRQAIAECISKKAESGESDPVSTNQIARSRVDGIFSYDHNNCINGGGPYADQLKQLNEKMQTAQESIDDFQDHNKRINKTVERLLPEIIATNVGDQFLVVINKDSKVWYSNDGLSVDITGVILNKLREQKPKISVGKRHN